MPPQRSLRTGLPWQQRKCEIMALAAENTLEEVVKKMMSRHQFQAR
jgi:hypothetical protein